ncbi:MAG TPA: DoxX family protein [Devosiaceae bacterium]|nr:DoxX family protein [Devosiaceae bacterium]
MKNQTTLASTAPIGGFVLRIVLVAFWVVHWWFKVGFHGMPATEAFFTSLGLPTWLAWFDISYEVVIAAMLLTGTFTWFAVITSLPILIASMIIYGHQGFYFPTGGIELPILWALMQIVLGLIGPGAYALKLPEWTNWPMRWLELRS